MNNWFKSTVGISLAGAFVLMANSGKGFFDSLWAAFLFMDKLADNAPLGLFSFLLASALAILVQAYINHYAKQLPCPRSGEFALGLTALVVGTGTMWIQLPTLNGLLLGLLSGFSAPFTYQAIASLWNLAFNRKKNNGLQ